MIVNLRYTEIQRIYGYTRLYTANIQYMEISRTVWANPTYMTIYLIKIPATNPVNTPFIYGSGQSYSCLSYGSRN